MSGPDFPAGEGLVSLGSTQRVLEAPAVPLAQGHRRVPAQLARERVCYQPRDTECEGPSGRGVRSGASSVCGEPLAVVGH